jgi:hypothetical protein
MSTSGRQTDLYNLTDSISLGTHYESKRVVTSRA